MSRRYGVEQLLAEVPDCRAANRHIPLPSVWRSVLLLFTLGLRSLNDLGHHLRRTGSRLVGSPPPSADTIARVLGQVDPSRVRAVLHAVNRAALRKKAVIARDRRPGLVATVDGHEFFSSRRRCCVGCSERTVKTRHGEVKEYYHRGVVCQLVAVTPPVILDSEMQAKEEGEITAARRLVERVLDVYGGLISVFTFDGLYVDTELIEMIRGRGIQVVVALKKEELNAFKELAALSAVTEPATEVRGLSEVIRYWDFDGIEVGRIKERGRVVRAIRTRTSPVSKPGKVNRREGGGEQSRDWHYLVFGSMGALLVDQVGHLRWEIENRAFHELATHGRLNHCFVHDPRAIENILTLLFLTFTLSRLFFERNVKQSEIRQATHLAQRATLLESVGSPSMSLPRAP